MVWKCVFCETISPLLISDAIALVIVRFPYQASAAIRAWDGKAQPKFILCRSHRYIRIAFSVPEIPMIVLPHKVASLDIRFTSFFLKNVDVWV